MDPDIVALHCKVTKYVSSVSLVAGTILDAAVYYLRF